MRPSRPSSPRRALHERSPSHTNESSPAASLRHVRSKSTHHSERYDRENREEQAVEDDGDDENTHEHDIYTSTPYPTKPEHVLLPSPGQGQQHPDHSAGTLSSSFLSSGEPSQLAESSSVLDHSAGDSWFNLVTSSQSWLNDPDSSRSSVPLQTQGHESHDETTVLQEEDEKKTIGSDDMNLPTVRTVNPVVSEPPSRHQSVYQSSEHGSSPNVMPIGPPSSPNFVALDTSSLNFVRLGTSSNPDSPSRLRSHSLSSSVNSMGTVIRHAGAAPWTHGSSSEQSSLAGRSFHSTPPYPGSAPSNSSSHPSHGRNGSRSTHSHSRSHTSSSRSGPGSDIQPNTDSSVFVQYPVIHPPSSSGSWAEASLEATRGPSDQPGLNQHDLIPERSESRITSHLSTVPSQWSAECDNSFATEGSSGAEPPARPETALGIRRDPSSSFWLTNDHSDERLDNISNLPVRDTHSRRPSSPSAHSRRTSSMRSIPRPGTSSSSSFMTNVLPTWAKAFYRDGHAANSTVSLSDPNRPPTRRGQPTGSSHVKRPSTARPKTRHGQRGIEDSAAAAEAEDPRDPRSHWATPEPEERPQTGWCQLRHSWSPHLYGDRGEQLRTSTWTWLAPSMDSRTEPFLGRRNLQVWSFCLGFIFPIGKLFLLPSQFYSIVC